MKIVSILVLALLLVGCASRPPARPSDICAVFQDKSGWYKAAVKSAKKWRSNIAVPMAIMYQESAFKARARPPYRFLLGVIPRGRASNAFGYAQALDSTWARYQREAGSRLSRRSNFADAIDFIQWYMDTTYKANDVAKRDAYAQYLNYHEGQGGYAKGSYKHKGWLMGAARKVEQRARRYASQLARCEAGLERKRRWRF